MLSFWKCLSGKDGDVEEAALAIVLNWERLDRLDIAWLATGNIQADGYTLKANPGKTLVEDLVEHHKDLLMKAVEQNCISPDRLSAGLQKVVQ